jgi:hypothetical protein
MPSHAALALPVELHPCSSSALDLRSDSVTACDIPQGDVHCGNAIHQRSASAEYVQLLLDFEHETLLYVGVFGSSGGVINSQARREAFLVMTEDEQP